MAEGLISSHHFMLRRLHSLSGIVPVGVFLVAHILTNSSLAWGRFALRGEGDGLSVSGGGVKYFQEEVSWINNEVPHLLLVEITLWVSIAFHSVLGFYYAATGRGNTGRYPHQGNLRYTLQRVSGYVGIVYIFYHVATLRWGWSFLVPGGTQWSHHFSASTLAAALRGDPYGWTAVGVIVSLFYLLGVSLLVFHFANGLWTAAITWGLTISEAAQRRWGYVCAAVGAAMMLGGWAAVGAAVLVPYDEALEIETRLLVEEHGADRAAEMVEEHFGPGASAGPGVGHGMGPGMGHGETLTSASGGLESGS